jgi:hypothetical protein
MNQPIRPRHKPMPQLLQEMMAQIIELRKEVQDLRNLEASKNLIPPQELLDKQKLE